MDFTKHIFEIIFNSDSSKVEEMTKVVKRDLLNKLYNAYSALCFSSTPLMCSDSVPSGNYSGIISSPHITTMVRLMDVVGGEGDDIF